MGSCNTVDTVLREEEEVRHEIRIYQTANFVYRFVDAFGNRCYLRWNYFCLLLDVAKEGSSVCRSFSKLLNNGCDLVNVFS